MLDPFLQYNQPTSGDDHQLRTTVILTPVDEELREQYVIYGRGGKVIAYSMPSRGSLFVKVRAFEVADQSTVTSLGLSKDLNLLLVGCNNGKILVHRFTRTPASQDLIELQLPGSKTAVTSIEIENVSENEASRSQGNNGGDSGRGSPTTGISSHRAQDCPSAKTYIVVACGNNTSRISSWVLRLGCEKCAVNDGRVQSEDLKTITLQKATKASVVHLAKVEDKIVLLASGSDMTLHHCDLHRFQNFVVLNREWTNVSTPSIPAPIACCFKHDGNTQFAVIDHHKSGSEVLMYDVRELLSTYGNSTPTTINFGPSGPTAESIRSIYAPSTFGGDISCILLITESSKLMSLDIATKSLIWSHDLPIAEHPRNVAACPVENLVVFTTRVTSGSPKTHLQAWRCPMLLSARSDSLDRSFARQTTTIATVFREVSKPLHEAVLDFAKPIPTAIDCDKQLTDHKEKLDSNTVAIRQSKQRNPNSPEEMQTLIQNRKKICEVILQSLDNGNTQTVNMNTLQRREAYLRKRSANVIACKQSLESARHQLAREGEHIVAAMEPTLECNDAYALFTFVQQHNELKFTTTIDETPRDAEFETLIQGYCPSMLDADSFTTESRRSLVTRRSRLLRSWHSSALQVWPVLSKRISSCSSDIHSQLSKVSAQLNKAKALVSIAKDVLNQKKENEARSVSEKIVKLETTLKTFEKKMRDNSIRHENLSKKFVFGEHKEDFWLMLFLISLAAMFCCWFDVPLIKFGAMVLFVIMISATVMLFKSDPIQKKLFKTKLAKSQQDVTIHRKQVEKLYGRSHLLHNFPQFHHDTWEAESQGLGCTQLMMHEFEGIPNTDTQVKQHLVNNNPGTDHGTFGIAICNVYKLRSKETGAWYGLKEFNKSNQIGLYRSELHIRALVGHHPNILPVNFIVKDIMEKDMLYLATPWQNFSLKEWKSNSDEHSLEDIHHVIHQMVVAVTHLHQHDVRHKDISLWNFLINTDNRNHVYLCDFANSRTKDSQPVGVANTSQVVGSRPFQDPKTHSERRQCRFSDDVYSLGLCMFALLKPHRAGDQPYPPESFKDARSEHANVRKILNSAIQDHSQFPCINCAKLILRMIDELRGCRPALVSKSQSEIDEEEKEQNNLGKPMSASADLVGAWLPNCEDGLPFTHPDPGTTSDTGIVQAVAYRRLSNETGLEFVDHDYSRKHIEKAKIFSENDAALDALLQVLVLRSTLQESSYTQCLKQFQQRIKKNPTRASDPDILDHICQKYRVRTMSDPRNDSVPIQWTLFHGTDSMDTAYSILREGLRVLKKTDHLWYGSGYYLTPDLDYARQYGSIVIVYRVVTCKHFGVVAKDESETPMKTNFDTHIVVVNRRNWHPIPKQDFDLNNSDEAAEFCIREAQQAKPLLILEFHPGLS